MTLRIGSNFAVCHMRRAQYGFTLLEVMLSVTILSISSVLILNSFIKSIRAIELSENYFKAGLLLEEKIYEVHNTDTIEEGVKEGIFSDFGARFSWYLDVATVEEGYLDELNLQVLWNKGNRKYDISLLTYLNML